MNSDSVVAQNLRRIMDDRGFRYRSIAEKAGYSIGQFSSLLNGRRRVTADDIVRIADTLNISPNELFKKPA